MDFRLERDTIRQGRGVKGLSGGHTATIYESADARSRGLIRRAALAVSLLVAGISLILTIINIARSYFAWDFFTLGLLCILSLAATLFIRAEKVTVGASFLIVAIELVIAVEPYSVLHTPLDLASYLIPNCLGLMANILLAGIFVGRLAVVVFTLASAADYVVLASMSGNAPVQDVSVYVVLAMLIAGFFTYLLNSLFQSALASAREEGRRSTALQEQLLHAQKMEAIGRFASGIAHDFNNILVAISCQADLVLLDEALPSQARTYLVEMRKYTGKAAALVSQLLVFSRRQPSASTSFDARDALASLESMLARLLGKGVTLRIPAAMGVSAIRADPRQFEQVVMNLVVNARDAMPQGGSIDVKLQDVDASPAGPTANPPLRPGPYVSLAVQDTGTGMGPDVMRHLFEPFFTTKPEGVGTGLGPSTVYGIVAQGGGGISVASAPGEGSTFVVYFPRA